MKESNAGKTLFEMGNEKQIAEEYRDFFDLANELADKDNAKYPLDKHETKRERFQRHILGMLQMYQVKYGGESIDAVRLMDLLIPVYPEDKILKIDSTDQQLIGFNAGWNACKQALYDNMPKMLNYLNGIEENGLHM